LVRFNLLLDYKKNISYYLVAVTQSVGSSNSGGGGGNTNSTGRK